MKNAVSSDPKVRLTLFAKAIVARGKCNTVNAVLDDYDSAEDEFYYYRNEYRLFKEIMRLMEHESGEE